MHIHLDPLGGIAGDMFAAALLDLAPDAGRELVAALHAAGLDARVNVAWRKVEDEVLAGTHFDVDDPAEHGAVRPPHHAVIGRGHGHVPYAHIRQRLIQAALPEGVRARADDILMHLARAEARVHGIANVDDVVFHEVGAQDSIADVVAAAFLVEAVRATSFSVGSLPLGAGTVQTAHGLLPIPAPATALLLEGFATHDDGIKGERVTPTGAAILRHLCGAAPGARKPGGVLKASGIGWGTKRFLGLPNVLRALSIDTAAALPFSNDGTVSVLACEIDDQTGEDLAVGLDHLRELPGVLDVVQAPLFGKKGRMMVGVRVLCRPDVEERAVHALLDETTTLGVRVDRVRRVELARAERTAEGVRTKTVTRPDGAVTVKREIDDVAALRSHARRQDKRR